MTEEPKKKIYMMYKLFGQAKDKDARCIGCCHLTSYTAGRKWYKCECYGTSSSAATDWRCSWHACGLYNQQYGGKLIKEVKKHQSKEKHEDQVEGQLSLFDNGEHA